MKFQVEQAALAQVLQKVLSITEKKTTMPVLSNVMIAAPDHASAQLTFYATDLELSLRTSIGGVIHSEGSTTVSARKMLEIIREVGHGPVTVEEQPNNRLIVEAGRSRFELPTIPAVDFPYLKFYEDTPFESCDGNLLEKCLEKTLYGIPLEEDPFSVSGLFLHATETNEIRFVASDGHRLVYFQVPSSALPPLEIGTGIIIPRKGVVEIVRMLEKEKDVSIGVHENCLTLRSPLTTLSIQLLEGGFPEYDLIIPAQRPFRFTVAREAFYHALKRVAVVTDQRWRHVRFIVTQGSLELDAGNPEMGNANDAVDIGDYTGEPFSVAFNIRYVMDAIQVMKSPEVTFEWVDEYHGGVFLGSEDPEYFSLIMPMVL
ncbi:MAG: DNA polymerase III subunit beta [Syntrophobacteraceae bacterium]|nr:DNA polymerase III subunit beta [Syntrophobacteraceae bacterium]